MDSDKIGKFIYQLRTEKNLSQYQLADKIPISRQAVSKWERGVTIPDSSTLMRLSEIFGVTINELLMGTRLTTNTIQELESITLNIVDDNNKKTKKIKRNIIISSAIISLLVFLFLVYYFVNSYNSIKLYRIFAQNEYFDIYDGIFVSTNQKIYLKVGNIESINEYKINSISLYYKDHNKKKYLAKGLDINRIIMEEKGYEMSFHKNQKLKNYYIEINYENNKETTLKLNFIKDYANNNLLFDKKKKYGLKMDKKSEETVMLEEKMEQKENTEEEKLQENSEKKDSSINAKENIEKENIEKENKNIQIKEEILTKEENLEIQNLEEIKEENELSEEEQIEIICKNGIEDNNSYFYEMKDKESTIKFIYHKMLKQLTMYRNDEIVWSYMTKFKIYKCEASEDTNVDLTNQEECKKMITRSLNNYIK